MWRYLKLLICLTSVNLFAAGNLNPPEKRQFKMSDFSVAFLSYPRSGSHLTLSLVQGFAGLPIYVRFSKNTPYISKNRLNLKLDNSQKPALRTHRVDCLQNRMNPDKCKLVLILRNYKECILRHWNMSIPQLLSVMERERSAFKRYISYLEYFDSWSNNRTKHIIYYEDLITKPLQVTKNLLRFIGYPENLISKVNQKKIENLSKQMYKSYIEDFGKEMTSGGKKAIYHSKNAKKIDLIAIDKSIQKNYPKLWKKYLCRYETK